MGIIRIFTISLLMVVVVMLAVPQGSAASEVEARQIIAEGESDLASAFMAVADAYVAGADVSVLSISLDEAGELLVRANNSFKIGDYDDAYLNASLCIEILNGVADDAVSLKAETEEAFKERLVLTASLSSVGLVALVAASVLIWMNLKHRHFKRVLRMRPKVEGDK